MEVRKSTINGFLEGQDKRFIIPVYQRDYAWNLNNCQKLWDDLLDLIKADGRQDHFLGTIVTIGNAHTEYSVIDGQQRLTTVSILLIALHNFLKSKTNHEESIIREKVLDFLVDKYSIDKEKRIRLKPNKKDREHFDRLFEDDAHNLKIDSNITNNYQFFYKKFFSSNCPSAPQLFEAFKKLGIVWIDLHRNHDDPQLIFESLNSTGVKLNSSDLIRNYILMDLEPAVQDLMHKKYWIEIEKVASDEAVSEVSNFIRIYLIFKQQNSIKEAEVYEEFKKFASKNFGRNTEQNRESLLKELLFFSQIYGYLVQNIDHPNPEINNSLEKLFKLEFGIARPFLLDVFNDFHSKILNESDVQNILKIIESYALRKMVVDGTQSLGKIFVTLSKEIKKEPNWEKQYTNILSCILLEKHGTKRFPSDEEFENSLINKEIYNQRKKRDFLLEGLENYKTAYPIKIDDLQVEHIMPQSIKNDKRGERWKKDLGNEWQEIHKKYVDTIGNLTLTGRNAEMSNKPYEDKKLIDYQTSKLKLNFSLDETTKWDDKAIVERAKRLVKDAKEIWSYPKTTYLKISLEEESFDLNSDDDFSGRKPLRVYFGEDENGEEVKTWRELLKSICRFLHNFNPTQFESILEHKKFKTFFKIKPKSQISLEAILESIDSNNKSAMAIFQICQNLCQHLGYSPDNIQFDLRKKSAKDPDGDN